MKIFLDWPILVLLLTSCCAPAADRSSGEVFGWGDNLSGEATGVPSSGNATGLVTIAGWPLTNTVAISAGDSHGLAIREDGTVVGWGWNLSGQAVGVRTPYPYRTNGMVTLNGVVLSNVAMVAASKLFSLALMADGSVTGWGELDNRARLEVPSGLSNVVRIAAGWRHGLAVTRDGTVVGWGEANKPPLGLTNVVAVAADTTEWGSDLALRRDGTVVEWALRGTAADGRQLAGLTGVVAVASGGGQCLALKRDGRVVEWHSGLVTPREVPGLSNVVAISAGGERSGFALRGDGTVAAWGGMRRPAVVPAGLTNIASIAAGENFCLALRTNLQRGWNGASPNRTRR